MGQLGGLLLIAAVVLAAGGLPYFLNEVAETQGDDALLAGRTLALLALIALGALTLAGLGALLLIFF